MNESFATDVSNARTSHGALTQTQKDLVANEAVLTAAEAGIVTNEASLTTAIANASKIFIANGFTLTAPVVIDKKVSINGNNQTLTGPATITGLSHNTTVVITANDVEVSNLIVDAVSATPGVWASPAARFGMQVYDATGVKLTNITLKKGQAGLLVNAATANASVDASGIKTDGNGFGGIEVYAAANQAATLNLSGNNTHTDLTDIAPIWSDGAGAKTVTAPGYTAGTPADNKTHYTKN